jgi:hypothetical protein
MSREPPLLLRAAEAWVALYTRGLPSELREARRAELRSDLWEHLQDAAAHGHSRLRWSAEVTGRVARGIVSDLWRRFERQAAARSRMTVPAQRQRVASLFRWVVEPVVVLGLLGAWLRLSTSAVVLVGALVWLFAALTVVRMKLLGRSSSEVASVPGGAEATAGPGRAWRLWLLLVASVLVLVGVGAKAALGTRSAVVDLVVPVAMVGVISSVLMLAGEYARRSRRQRRGE